MVEERHDRHIRAVQRKIIQFIYDGFPPWKAATKAGLSKSLFYVFISRGEKGEEPYASFFKAVTFAEEEAKSMSQARQDRQQAEERLKTLATYQELSDKDRELVLRVVIEMVGAERLEKRNRAKRAEK